MLLVAGVDYVSVFELALDTDRPDDTILNLADVEKDVDALYHTGRGSNGKEKVIHLLIRLTTSLFKRT
jgi:annexin A7/11